MPLTRRVTLLPMGFLLAIAALACDTGGGTPGRLTVASFTATPSTGRTQAIGLEKLRKALLAVEGVASVRVEAASRDVTVAFAPDVDVTTVLHQAAYDAGFILSRPLEPDLMDAFGDPQDEPRVAGEP